MWNLNTKSLWLGFQNNNCLKTGCVQGGIGYWQLYRRKFPDRFDRMAEREHKLTDIKGKPVTMLRIVKNKITYPLFLKPHPDYPHLPRFEDQKVGSRNLLLSVTAFVP